MFEKREIESHGLAQKNTRNWNRKETAESKTYEA